MSIKLGKIKLENFKCFQSKTVDFLYRNADVEAENGNGKTSVADGVFWVLTDKNSAGDKKFGVRPVYTDPNSPHFSEPIPNLVVSVEVTLLIYGVAQTFRKEQHEKTDKQGKLSYPNKYWIDGYSIPEGKYKEAWANIIPEDKLKMLTDIDYFNNDDKLSRTDRRKALVDMAGQIGTPAGHESLLARLNGHDVAEEKKRLKDSRILLEKEQESNVTRIDEKLRDIKKYVPGDSAIELAAKRDLVKESIDDLEGKRSELFGKEKERQGLIEKANELTSQRSQRESELRSDNGATARLADEKVALESEHAEKVRGLVNLQGEIRQINTTIESVRNEIGQSLLTLTSVKDEYKKAKEKPADETCYACGQKLPADMMADNENKRQTALANIDARGIAIKKAVDERKVYMLDCQAKVKALEGNRDAMVEELKTAEVEKNKRIAKIDAAIVNRPTPDPKEDGKWRELSAEIDKVKARIGEPVTQQLGKIEARRKAAEAELNQINDAISAYDAVKDAEVRIIELETRQRKIAQLIADINKQLDEIGQYHVAQSKMVEAAVNGMFQHVTYRLFEYYQNGEINDQVCVALLDGKPYPDLSKGEKVFANNDVVNTLGNYYGIDVFRFIDDTGDITLPIEANSQTIKLMAVKGVKELKVTVEEDAKEKVEAA